MVPYHSRNISGHLFFYRIKKFDFKKKLERFKKYFFKTKNYEIINIEIINIFDDSKFSETRKIGKS